MTTFTERCVYTIRHSDKLREIATSTGADTFEAGQAWTQVEELLESARHEGQRLPIVFAPAESTDRIVAWATIDAVTIREEKPRTRYSFSGLRMLAKGPKKTSLLKASDRSPLAANFIRPYAVCLTPKFVRDAPIQSVADTTAEVGYPDEMLITGPLREGSVRTIKVNSYERNFLARKRCLEHYGYACSVCSMEFGKVYGSVAEGFIHVHHLKPLSEIGDSYEVDPIADLRPVCPNCHAVLHSRGVGQSPFTIDELRLLMSGSA
jgi:hypothetical protein